jgi:general secretion pathway protein A
MYRQYYGLKNKPFELTPDSETLFLSESHQEALSVLRYGVMANKGFLVLTGGIGTGKTTLINVLAKTLEGPRYLCVLSNPTLSVADFYYYFAAKLGLLFDGNKAKFLLLFAKLIEECQKHSSKILLIIDEAQALPIELLEEIRFLANLSPEAQTVLSIFFVGQPELLDHLALERLLPLRQRIAIRFHVEPLSQADTLQYVLFRLDKAGAQRKNLFTEKAMALIHRATGGNPRLINILCDNALVSGYANDATLIDDKIIESCVEELCIPGDERTFFLPAKKPGLSRKWIMLGVVVAIVEVIGIYFAYASGWLDTLRKYVF